MYLDGIALPGDPLPDGFPFTLPVFEQLTTLAFTTQVTFFVGENGSGKSTLLEAIACGMQCPAIGASDTGTDPALASARRLAGQIRFQRSARPRTRLLFRAEDASLFARRVLAEQQDLEALEQHFDESLSGYGRDLATSAMQGQRSALSVRYGEDPHAMSHGEWFLKIVQQRVHQDGLYLLDEPETPLSPIHQLTLLSELMEASEHGAQFIIATHSPMLMALPGATIYEFGDTGIREVDWDAVEHVALMRAFLQDPERYLRHL